MNTNVSKLLPLDFQIASESVDLLNIPEEPYGQVLFTLKNPEDLPRFSHRHPIMREMLRCLRETTNDWSWSIRYASQVRKENLPFFHSSKHRVIIFDPLLPYRDCVCELYRDKTLCWNFLPSQSYYFKSQSESMHLFKKEREEALAAAAASRAALSPSNQEVPQEYPDHSGE